MRRGEALGVAAVGVALVVVAAVWLFGALGLAAAGAALIAVGLLANVADTTQLSAVDARVRLVRQVAKVRPDQ